MRKRNQVQVGLDRMNGRAIRKMGRPYNRETIAPLLDVIRSAKSPEGLSRALSPALFRKMKTDALESAMQGSTVQAGLIGAASVAPRRSKNETEDR